MRFSHMQKPICSIVIPAQNCLAFLPAALASIELQQADDLEVIVVDDGSTDGTGAWLEAQARERRGMRLLRGAGAGPSKARNLGIAAAAAPLIAFLDADDWWLPNKLLAQIAFHNANPSAGFSFGDYLHITPDGLNRGTCFDYWRSDIRRRGHAGYADLPEPEAVLLATNLVGTSTVVARKDALEACGGFSGVLPSADDWELWLRLACRYSVGCTKAVTGAYLMRPGSVTSRRQHRISALQSIVDRYEGEDRAAIKKAVAIAKGRLQIAKAELAQESGFPASAAAHYFQALMTRPSQRYAKAAAASIVAAAWPPFGKRGGRRAA
jgi:glycosyltransferase involved in cell wall biosynthesis